MEEKEKEKGKKYFRTHEDLAIYQLAFETAMNVLRRCGKCGRIREEGKKLIQSQSAPLSSHTSPSSHPPHTLERRSSRSVCANLAEASDPQADLAEPVRQPMTECYFFVRVVKPLII
jgi:hypothetical protein